VHELQQDELEVIFTFVKITKACWHPNKLGQTKPCPDIRLHTPRLATKAMHDWLGD
jgi:hypothetical protein